MLSLENLILLLMGIAKSWATDKGQQETKGFHGMEGDRDGIHISTAVP